MPPRKSQFPLERWCFHPSFLLGSHYLQQMVERARGFCLIGFLLLLAFVVSHAKAVDWSTSRVRLSGHSFAPAGNTYSVNISRLNALKPVIDSQRSSGSNGASVFTYNYNVAVVPLPVCHSCVFVLVFAP
jgi:hypothetical protein